MTLLTLKISLCVKVKFSDPSTANLSHPVHKIVLSNNIM